MGWLAALGSGISGIIGDIAGNDQNKANQKNADNQAAAARQYDTQALQTALNNYAAYIAANPSPASQYGNIKAPQSLYGNQTQVNSPTTSVGAPPSASAPTQGGQSLQSLVQALLSGGGQNGTPQAPAGNVSQTVSGSLQNALMPQTHMSGTPQRRIPLPGSVAAPTLG